MLAHAGYGSVAPKQRRKKGKSLGKQCNRECDTDRSLSYSASGLTLVQQSRVTSNPPPSSSSSSASFFSLKLFDLSPRAPTRSGGGRAPRWLLQCQGKRMRPGAAPSDCHCSQRQREENNKQRRELFCANGEIWIRIVSVGLRKYLLIMLWQMLMEEGSVSVWDPPSSGKFTHFY